MKEAAAQEQLPAIDRASLVDATAASIVFGMWDAHGENIWVALDGKLKFFNNSYSLPNSNGYLYHNQKFRAAFRSSLFEIKGTYAPLTAAERKHLKAKVYALLEMKPGIDLFFDSLTMQRALAALPPGWLDLDGALSALFERLLRMAKALASPQVKSLRDLVVASIPNYRFALLISTACVLVQKHQSYKDDPNYHNYLAKINSPAAMEELQCSIHIHRLIGYKCELEQIEKLLRLGVDVSYLHQLAKMATSHKV
jgi:hypothetical protein